MKVILAYMVRLGALRAMHGEVSKTRWTRISYESIKESPNHFSSKEDPCQMNRKH
jgi:hypothetical protein